MFTVAVVDDSPVARTGMARTVSDDPAFTIAAEVASVHDLDQLRIEFDIVVLDLSGDAGEPAIDLIARLARTSRPVITSSWDRQPTVLAAVRAGAHGCLTHHSAREAVNDALRAVAHGCFYLCPQLVPRFHTELRRPVTRDGLAPREVETLRCIALGLTHAQIATRMGLSQATVNTYAKRIRSKLHVNNKAELTRIAIEMGHLIPERGNYHRA